MLVGLIAGCASTITESRVATTTQRQRGPAVRADTLGTAPNHNANLDEVVARGLELYRQQYCGTCHKLDKADTGGIFGPPHNGIGAIAAQRIRDEAYTGRATTAEDYLRESLVDPGRYLVPGFENTRYRMPAYTHLSETDLNALVQMLLREE